MSHNSYITPINKTTTGGSDLPACKSQTQHQPRLTTACTSMGEIRTLPNSQESTARCLNASQTKCICLMYFTCSASSMNDFTFSASNSAKLSAVNTDLVNNFSSAIKCYPLMMIPAWSKLRSRIPRVASTTKASTMK